MALTTRLYRGEVSYDFLSRRRIWYALSGLVVLISLVSMLVRGFNLSIDFKGGDSFQFPTNGRPAVATANRALSQAGVSNSTVEVLGEHQVFIQTPALTGGATGNGGQTGALEQALIRDFGLRSSDQLSPQSVGPSWGGQITSKAIEGLVIFLIAVVVYIGFRFESKMATAAIVALIHDMLITAGIYSLVGFQVSPATVIALLTILGFSLYDTVVVFDKVRENTRDLGPASRVTYSQAANLAVNQTIMRSINTSLIALLPVGSLLFVGAGLLGAGTLKDLALAQFVGLASGAYSSIFIATPLLAQLKEREPEMRRLAARVARSDKANRADGSASLATGAAGTGPATAGSAPATSVGLLERPDPDRPEGFEDDADGTGGAETPPVRIPGAPMQRSGTPPPRRRGGAKGRPSGKRKR
jgi:preprotein translocase subunit SecF